MDLQEAGRLLTALPLVRVVYESALTAAWLSQSREAVGGMHAEEARKRQQFVKALERSASEVFQAGAAGVQHTTLDEDLHVWATAEGQARNFEQLCGALSESSDPYAIYRSLSMWCHPSSMVMDQYLVLRAPVVDGEGPQVTLRQQPHQPGGDETWLVLTVASVMWAARALEVMTTDHRHRRYLRQVARTLGVAHTLDLTPTAKAKEARAAQARRRAQWKGPRRHRAEP